MAFRLALRWLDVGQCDPLFVFPRMTIPRALILALGFIAVLHITDRVIAGMVQCEAANACPYAREFGGVK